MQSPLWMTAFLDVPPAGYDAAVAFWGGVTGYAVSAPRGDHAEFATLVPPEGDPHLRVQRVADGPGGVHLDLHHPDQVFAVRQSPAALAYCEVDEPLRRRAPAPSWPGGHRAVVDQVCIDISPSRYEKECAFWSERTGWPLEEFAGEPEFRALVRPPEQPVRILLQRLDDEQPRATAHLDLATDDREAETRRHEALGATVQRHHDGWTVLTDPAGSTYCVTDRAPAR